MSLNLLAINELRVKLENGVRCAVASLNPQQIKKDFQRITGHKLKLKKRKGFNGVYDASLI